LINNIEFYSQVYKDWLKRKYIDLVRRGDRLQTPMEMQINLLNAYSYLQKPIIALELFGMHGLWHTIDYASICSYLELYELNHVYAIFAKKFIKNAMVVEADSINVVLNNKLKKKKYNFIVSDNPLGSPFGNNYFEHFDLFPEIIDYVEDEGVLSLNFIYNDLYSLSKQHSEKRTEFYGNGNPSIREAVDVYKGLFMKRGKAVVDFLFLPRNKHIGYLSLIVKGGEV
jgi:hypothetical protein